MLVVKHEGKFGDVVRNLQEVCRVPATAVMNDKDHNHLPLHVEVEKAQQLKALEFKPWNCFQGPVPSAV
jgi:hypothetical protein